MTDRRQALADAGDVVWVDFGETLGHEQAGARPALVLTSAMYHSISRTALVCPISRNVKPWPFKVMLTAEEPVQGAVLVDQLRVVDRAGRGFRRIGRISDDALRDVRGVLAAVVGLSVPTP